MNCVCFLYLEHHYTAFVHFMPLIWNIFPPANKKSLQDLKVRWPANSLIKVKPGLNTRFFMDHTVANIWKLEVFLLNSRFPSSLENPEYLVTLFLMATVGWSWMAAGPFGWVRVYRYMLLGVVQFSFLPVFLDQVTIGIPTFCLWPKEWHFNSKE